MHVYESRNNLRCFLAIDWIKLWSSNTLLKVEEKSLLSFLSLSSIIGASDENNLASVNNRDYVFCYCTYQTSWFTVFMTSGCQNPVVIWKPTQGPPETPQVLTHLIAASILGPNEHRETFSLYRRTAFKGTGNSTKQKLQYWHTSLAIQRLTARDGSCKLSAVQLGCIVWGHSGCIFSFLLSSLSLAPLAPWLCFLCALVSRKCLIKKLCYSCQQHQEESIALVLMMIHIMIL